MAKKASGRVAANEPEGLSIQESEGQQTAPPAPSERVAPPEPPAPEVFHPATMKQKVSLATMLVAWTVASLVMAWVSLNSVQDVLYVAVETDWRCPSNVRLATGPVGFRHDSVQGKLKYIGPMSDETRLKLAGLFPTLDDVPSDSEAAQNYERDLTTYSTAVDILSEESLLLANKYVVALLLLGGCCGMVGVQLRSMWDFIRNLCFKDPPELDVVTWWPWYLMRPLIGFVLGILAISMIMSGFLEVDNQSPRSSLWWLSITALVGFGASEFMARLRLVVAALFAAQG
ncbi:MAG: hypothetical protein H8E66_23505 [Planctomycetes bacterium]|nr:hypothetical protein [Planctomycetota bacterium]